MPAFRNVFVIGIATDAGGKVENKMPSIKTASADERTHLVEQHANTIAGFAQAVYCGWLICRPGRVNGQERTRGHGGFYINHTVVT
jgi:hypothetical protein